MLTNRFFSNIFYIFQNLKLQSGSRMGKGWQMDLVGRERAAAAGRSIIFFDIQSYLPCTLTTDCQRIAFNHTFLALWQRIVGQRIAGDSIIPSFHSDNGLPTDCIQSYLPSTLMDCPRFTFNLGVMKLCWKSGVWNRYCCRGIFWSFLKSIIICSEVLRASLKLVDFWHQIWTQHFNHHRYLAGITCLSENYMTASIALDPTWCWT